jgi:hypothetical protein
MGACKCQGNIGSLTYRPDLKRRPNRTQDKAVFRNVPGDRFVRFQEGSYQG